MEHEEFLMLPVNQLVSTIYVKSTFKFLDKELKIVPILINISHLNRIKAMLLGTIIGFGILGISNFTD